MQFFPRRAELSFQHIRVMIFLFAIAVTLGVIIFVYFRSVFQTPVRTMPPTNRASTEEPAKIDFGTKIPEDFPANIPLEAGVKLNQSYSLDYSGQKQLTAGFASKETVKRNYDFYKNFFQKDGWAVTSQFESESISSLYALKEKNEMNVTVSARELESGSQVSISILKK